MTVIGLTLWSSAVFAQQATVLLNASPNVIMADGHSATTITATISGSDADQVPDGTIVHFTSTSGTLSATSVASVGGIARVTLTSSPVEGYATVTANFIGGNGSGNGSFQVEFTSDKDLADTDQGEADWIRIASADYLAYSADSQVIDASCKDRGVKFSYRGLVIVADALQADMSNGAVRARNAILQRGHKQIAVRLLAYSILSGSGEALSDPLPGSRSVQIVSIKGSDISEQPLSHDDFNSSALEFVDISSSRVLVTATAVSVRMNDKIQLKHASVFVDSKRIISMPYQIMPLNTNETFGQQIVGYGSDGLFLDVPYYASVSPKSTGAFYLRSTSAAQQDGTYYSGRQGLALDYVEKYGTFDGKTSGQFNVMGLSRQDWGASWTHTEQFNNSLHGYFYVDVPEHNSLFASTNIVQQMRGFSVNLDTSQSNSAAVEGFSSKNQNIETYIQSDAHRLSGTRIHGFFYSTNVTLNDSVIKTFSPNQPAETQTVSTKSAGLNLFTSPFVLNKITQLSDSFNVSQTQANNTGVAGVTANADLNMTTRFTQTTTSTLTYQFSHDPVTGNILNESSIPVALRPSADQSNYSWDLNLAPKSNRWSSSLISTYSQPLGNSSVSAQLELFPTSVWNFGIDESYSEYAGYAFRDMELTLGRRIGARELQIYWSSIDRQFRFNMGSAQF